MLNRFRFDPRHYQIAVLSGLLGYAMFGLALEIRPAFAIAVMGTGLLAQIVLGRLVGLERVDVRSALITSLSLSLLLRSTEMWWLVIASVIAIASKFLVRWNGRHVYNPSMFGIAVTLLLTDQVWVSPGQWGQAAWFAAVVAMVGLPVVSRVFRSEMSFVYVFFYGALLMVRAWYLNDPVAIPLHQVQNGALLIFAFFMISDPKTSPDARAGKILYAGVVAAVTFYVQFGLYKNNGPIWALFILSPLVPVLNRCFVADSYDWNQGYNRMKP